MVRSIVTVSQKRKLPVEYIHDSAELSEAVGLYSRTEPVSYPARKNGRDCRTHRSTGENFNVAPVRRVKRLPSRSPKPEASSGLSPDSPVGASRASAVRTSPRMQARAS